MRRRNFMKRYSGRIALTFLLLCLIIYTVYHAVGSSSGSLLTTPAREITDVGILGGEAWLFRDETLLTSPSEGLVNSIAESGEKVGKNTLLCEVWSGGTPEETAAKQTELDRINRTIRILEKSLLPAGSTVAAADGYRADAMTELLKLQMALREGNWSTVPAIEADMLVMLNRYGALTGKEGAAEAALEQAKAEREALLTGDRTALTNTQSSAYYYDLSHVDGFEALFTEEALSTLTAESFATLKQAEPAAAGEGFTAGKLCYGYSWHLAVEFSAGAGELFAADEVYSIRFPENNGMELLLTCERLLIGAGGEVVAIFRSDVTPLDFDYQRSQSVEITVGSTTGFYIPQKAVAEQNGVTGVYIFHESTVKFRRIAVLLSGDGYLIAAREDPSPEQPTAYLSQNDLIITSGKNLYDGKVYQ